MFKNLFSSQGKGPGKTAPIPETPPAPEAQPKPTAPSAPPPEPVKQAPPPPAAAAVPAPSAPAAAPTQDQGSTAAKEIVSAKAASISKSRDISLYKNLMAGLYDGILIVDSTGLVIGSNPRAESFLGYPGDELWGMRCEELVVGVNSRVLHMLHSHAQEGRFTVVNGSCKRKDGTSFPSEIAISRIRLLNEGDLIFSIRSTERREKAREGRESGEEAIRFAAAGILVCTTEGRIVFVNPAFVKLLGAAGEEDVLNHMIGDFCTSYEVAKAMTHAPSSQGTWLGSLELVTAKGIKREVLVTAAMSPTKHGNESHLVLTMTPLPKAVM